MDTGKKLKARREELKLTLEQVGDIVGVSKSTVAKWESGFIENMKRDKIMLLSKALEVSPLWIIGTEEETESHVENYGSGVDKYINMLHERPDLRVLLDSSYKTTAEDIEALVKLIETMKK